jgi:glycosyltransferase involved in cell wall biosynthesis
MLFCACPIGSIGQSNGTYKKLNPLVSIIIPAFNAADFISQALKSVHAQTYQEIEVIVVDDGSTDDTYAIVEEFAKKDDRFRLVRQCNAGVGAARNTAIGEARGKYIAPMDADDLFFPEKLEKQVACMEKWGSETGLVYCGTTVIDEDGDFVRNLHLGFVRNVHLGTLEGRLRLAVVLRNVVGSASVPLLRATALEKVGPYLTRAEQRGAQGCEDWDLHIRIAEHYSIRVVPEYLLAYRETRSSMSVNAETMAASFAVVSRRARERNRDLPTATFRWSAGYFYEYLVGTCDRWDHYSWRFRYLKKAVCANPFYFLRTWTYKEFIRILLSALTGSTRKKLVKQLRRSSEKNGQEDLNSKETKKRLFISNRMFEIIERRRWRAALHAGD